MIPGYYVRKAAKMDRLICEEERDGPCSRRLEQFGLLKLVWGAFGEASEDVHRLVAVLAECRVRTLTLRGDTPGPHQLGLETTVIRRRLSSAAVKAANSCLIGRLSQIGEGGGLAGKRRQQQRQEEWEMSLQKEADWVSRMAGKEIVRRGRFWSG